MEKRRAIIFAGIVVAILVMAMSMGCIEEVKEEKEKIAEEVKEAEKGFAEEVKEEKTAPVAEELKERFVEGVEAVEGEGKKLEEEL